MNSYVQSPKNILAKNNNAEGDITHDSSRLERRLSQKNFSQDSEFSILMRRKCFIDKSLFIKEIIDNTHKINLFLRPRRFGKSSNLSMLYNFFSRSLCKEKNYFVNLKIWKEDKKYKDEFRKYAVIRITFRDLGASTYEIFIAELKSLISEIYKEFESILVLDGPLKNDKIEKENYTKIMNKQADEQLIKESLKKLTTYLSKKYQTKDQPSPIVILIDEYDTPIRAATENNYYDKMRDVMKLLLQKALTDNSSINQVIITGIVGFNQTECFYGIKFINICGLSMNKFSEYFGFLSHEIKEQILDEKLPEEKKDAILKNLEEWYGGYQIGNNVLLNPYSVIQYIEKVKSSDNESWEVLFENYWVNVVENTKAIELMTKYPFFRDSYKTLLESKYLKKEIEENYQVITNDLNYLKNKDNLLKESVVWGLLYYNGYITGKIVREEGKKMCNLTIPNKEIHNLYQNSI